MKIIIADSSSLILLTKCNLLEILTKFFPVLIPEAVHNEVVNSDTIERFTDAKNIARIVADKKVQVVKAAMLSQKMPLSLGRGETEALMLAKQTKDAVLATDDGKAIKTCKYLGVPFIISPRIAADLYRLNAIDFADARSAVEKMKIIGRYSADIISETLLELEAIRDAETDNR